MNPQEESATNSRIYTAKKNPRIFHHGLASGLSVSEAAFLFAGTEGLPRDIHESDEFEIRDIKTRASAPPSLANPGRVHTSRRMGLSCLLLTSDATLLEVDLELRTDAASAIELSARRHHPDWSVMVRNVFY